MRRLAPVAAITAAVIVLGPLAAACSSSSGATATTKRYEQCVDKNNHVVPRSKCDTHAAHPNPYFIILVLRQYPLGSRVTNPISRFAADDETSRANAGLPKTGSVPEEITVEEGNPAGPAYHAPPPEPEQPPEHFNPPPPPEHFNPPPPVEG